MYSRTLKTLTLAIAVLFLAGSLAACTGLKPCNSRGGCDSDRHVTIK